MVLIFPHTLLFNFKTNLEGVEKVEETIEQFGSRMRLTGRDFMRLGAMVDRFFSSLLDRISGVLKSSMIWQAYMEDLDWAFEEVGDVMADMFAPALEIITDLVESFADALERSPLLQWLVRLLLIGLVIGKVSGMLQQFLGSLHLFFGIIINATRGSITFSQALHALWTGFFRGTEAAVAYIDKVRQVSSSTKVSLKGLVTSFTDWIKAMGGAKGLLKALFKWTFLLGGAGFFTLLAFMALTRLGEPLMELFEAICDALEPLFEPLEGVIEWFTDWIEENPELARQLFTIIGIIGLLIVGFLALSKISAVVKGLGKVVDVLTGGFSKLITPTKSVSKGAWQATLANAALIASVALLITALTYFFTSLLSMGVGIWEAVGALIAVLGAILAFIVGLALVLQLLPKMKSSIWMGVAAILAIVVACVLLAWAMTELLKPLMAMPGGVANLYLFAGALILLMAALTGIAIVLGSFSAIALLGSVIMFLLAAAAIMLGTAMLLAGIGIQMAAQGIILLVGNLGAIVALVPAVFGLAIGIAMLGMAGLVAFAGLVALAAGVLILSAALMALMIPLGIIRALGGEGAVVETLRHLPYLEEGGIITAGGLAVVHEGEEVRPAEAVKRGKEEVMAPPLVVNINAPIGSREIAEAFADEIGKIMDRKFKRAR